LATLTKLPSGSWRAQVRRKGRYISETFAYREDARRWASDAERAIDQGKAPKTTRIADKTTFAHLIDLHIEDLKAVKKPIGRTKSESLKLLRASLGHRKYAELDRVTVIDFGRTRAKGGTGPVTLSMYIGYIKTVLEHAFAVHDIETSVEPVEQARLALKHLGLVGKSQERDRRPTEEELARLFAYFDANVRLTIPMSRILRFAIATAMRQDEICRVTWDDYNARTKTLLIKDRKDPRAKYGNDQRIPLVDLSGFDPIALIEEQRAHRSNESNRIFPYNGKSAGMAFYRAANDLQIEDLTFHDMRHEGTSRLFEAGLQIPEVALITGHKDWKMLKRYTHLKAEHLHSILAKRSAA
jgi:integrase